MAKGRNGRGAKKAKPTKRSAAGARSGRRPSPSKRRAAATTRRPSPARKRTAPKRARRGSRRSARAVRAGSKAPRLDRARRTLEETVPTPPSSLDMVRRGSAVRTGRAELAESRQEHAGMTPDITGGDVDTDLDTAYFSGDGAPGGDNPSPDQDVVDDIGKALGVEYQDNEELRSSDKVVKRDKHRWELDPASSEDYKDRK